MNIVYDFDMVKPLPPRVTTEGYKVLDKELQQVLCEQNKLRLEEMQMHTFIELCELVFYDKDLTDVDERGGF